ncbi:MAG: Xaa-Pro peptidase family protein [Acidobacteriota bacterium]
MLTRDGCVRRTQRLLHLMEAQRLDLFVTANYRTVYYFTGSLTSAESPVVLAIRGDGKSSLIISGTAPALADETTSLELWSIHRVIDRPMHDAAGTLRDVLAGQPGVTACGVERAATPGLIEQTVRDVWPAVQITDAGPLIRRLRKRKEADEVEEIRASLRLIAAAYEAARAAIGSIGQNGGARTELDVYNEMQAAVVREAGTFVPLHGDFAAGERAIRGGGPPTARPIGPNDLYILDLFPAPALYFGDTCRTFAVGTPTELQMQAWEIVSEAVRLGERAVRPGVRARDVYAVIKEFLDSKPVAEKSFWHHAGHGIGHHGHEAPRLIPGSDDIFEAGDVITIEPGIYTPALHGGIRLEDNYLVREDGLENLFHYPREL